MFLDAPRSCAVVMEGGVLKKSNAKIVVVGAMKDGGFLERGVIEAGEIFLK